MAFAAPVEVGTMLSAAARARRRSLCGASCRFWSCVYAWIVVIRPLTIPNSSLSALAIGPRQFVVQDAFEMMWCAFGSYDVWLTPITIVTSSFFAGAEMITFLAPPSMCALALVASVKNPVDSTTTSTPRSFHGSCAGSRSARIFRVLLPYLMPSSTTEMSSGNRPRIESYFSRCAIVVRSPRSLAATTSMSAPPWLFRACTARKKLRPIRPDPLMPTRTVTGRSPRSRVTGQTPGGATTTTLPWPSDPTNSPSEVRTGNPEGPRSDLLGEHLRAQAGLGVGDPELLGALVGHRQQPADPAGDRVLGERRDVQLPELLQGRRVVLQAEVTGHLQVVGHLVAEDLQGPFHTGAGRHRGAGGAAQVRVVEVREPVRGGPHLAPHPALLPGHQRLVRAQPGEQHADRVTVPDHHPVHAADLACLGRDAQPARGSDERERRLRTGAGDLQGGGPARLRQRAVCQERAPPCRDRVATGAGDDLRRKTADRTAPAVEETGLAGQRLAVPDHPHDVPAALADPVAGDHHHVGGVAVDLRDVPPEPARGGAGVELGLHHDPAADDVQAAGEPQHRGDLRLATTRLGDLSAGQLRLHLCRHRHAPDPATSAAFPELVPERPTRAARGPGYLMPRRESPHRHWRA